MCERGVEGNGDYEEAGCADGYDRKIGGYHTLASEKKGKDLALRMQSCSTKVCAGHSTRTVPVLHNQWEEDPNTHHLHTKSIISHSMDVYQALPTEIKTCW